MFHVERYTKTLAVKGFLLFFISMISFSCMAPRATIQIQDYILMDDGKKILDKKEGLTAFIFENDQRKYPFVDFITTKYNLGSYYDVEYWVTIDGQRFKVFLYDNAELEKYFVTSQFMVSNVETEATKITNIKFIALSMISDRNEDVLRDDSLYQGIAIKYLKDLKNEFLKN